MRTIPVSAMAFVLPFSGMLLGSSLDDAFQNGSVEGEIRPAYITQDNPSGTEDTSALSLGGQLNYETARWYGVRFGIAAYISQVAGFASGEGEERSLDFSDAAGDAYAYVGEAYFDAVFDALSIRIGRQQIDTPFANTDDIRMHPNTFEGALATYTGVRNLTLTGGYLTHWAGYDSGPDISEFKRFAEESRGGAVVGAIFEGVEHLPLQAWFYRVDKIGTLAYADGVYTFAPADEIEMEFAVQAAYMKESDDSGIDGMVGGLSAGAAMGPVGVVLGWNQAQNDAGCAPTNGFGGGPYVTSMEEMTIDGLEDAAAYLIAAEIDLGVIGAENLAVSAAYGYFESGTDDDATEYDMILSYAFSDTFSAELSYAAIEDGQETLDGDWSRWLTRAFYRF